MNAMSQTSRPVWTALSALLVWAFALVMPLAAQENLVQEVAVIEDKSGDLTFAEVLTMSPRVYHGLLSCGYSPSTWWVRVTLAPPSASSPVVLHAWPQFLDEISLFDPQAPDASPRLAGDKYPAEAGHGSVLNHTFVVRPSGEGGSQYWLRVRSESSVVMSVSALALGSVDPVGRRADFFNDLFIGFLICSMLWAAVSATTQPDRLVGCFLLKQIVHLCYFVFLMGYARVWLVGVLSPTWVNHLTNFFVVSAGACAMWFHYLFMRLHKGQAWALRVLLLMLLWYPVELAFLFSGHARIALHSRMILNLCGPVLLLAASLGSPARIDLQRSSQCLPRKTLIVFYCFMCAVLVPVMIPFLMTGSWVNYVRFTFCAEGLLTGGAVMVLIYWRSLRTMRLHARRGYKTTQLERRLKAQRARNLEQQHFISILAHELKTPLSIVRLSLASGGVSPSMAKFADQAVMDMSGLIERCANALQLEAESPVVCLEPCNVLAECAVLCGRLDDSRRIRVTPTSGLEGFKTDVGLFKIILGNLLDNALKYGQTSEPVTLSFEVAHQAGTRGLSLVVASPPGPAGFPDAEKVFQKFYRSPGAQRSVGAGLGLFLVKGITRLLGGSISYCRRADLAVFSVWLPWLSK